MWYLLRQGHFTPSSLSHSPLLASQSIRGESPPPSLTHSLTAADRLTGKLQVLSNVLPGRYFSALSVSNLHNMFLFLCFLLRLHCCPLHSSGGYEQVKITRRAASACAASGLSCARTHDRSTVPRRASLQGPRAARQRRRHGRRRAGSKSGHNGGFSLKYLTSKCDAMRQPD